MQFIVPLYMWNHPKPEDVFYKQMKLFVVAGTESLLFGHVLYQHTVYHIAVSDFQILFAVLLND